MVDVVDRQTRSRMMSGIRGANTKPEIMIRKSLHSRGFRYRLHSKGLPGKPDIILPKYRVAIFVHGCFWHCHDCHLFKWPSTREQFWRNKLTQNAARDRKNTEALMGCGWRVLVIWECSIKNTDSATQEKVIDLAEKFITGSDNYLELATLNPARLPE